MSPSVADPFDDIQTVPLGPKKESARTVVESAPTVTTQDAPADVPVEATPCPKCDGKLIDPQGLGWCAKCGYCRSLEATADKAPPPAVPTQVRKTSPLGVVEFFQVLGTLPGYFWVTVAVAIGMIAVAMVADFLLPDLSLPRALWSTVQFALGFLVLFLAGIWAMFLVAANEDSLGAKDLFFPFKLWRIAIKRLPATRKPVWLGAWSLTAMLSAVFVVGGYEYWYRYYKPKKRANTFLKDLAAAAAGAGDNKSLEESLKDVADSQNLTGKKDDKDKKDKGVPKEDRRPTEQCLIIGYTLDDGKLSGLVLARSVNNRLRFGGVVKQGWDDLTTKELLQRLGRLKRPEPVIRGLKLDAIWVNPALFCEVHQSGADADGRLVEPNFKALLD